MIYDSRTHSLRLRPASHVPAAAYALLLALLPATATIVGAVVLGQIPSPRDVVGIVLVMAGVAIHKPAEAH
nr:EamA family transporter [Romeria gracilis]